MYKCKIPVLLVVFAVFSGFVQAQEIQRSKGHFSGSLETNWGFYMKDDKLGVKKVEDKVATNTYLTLGYSFKAFRFGLEYDIYEPPMIGFSPEWEGCKLMRGFAEWTGKSLELRAGTVYEQFGSGLIFRTYEERALGINNALMGGEYQVASVGWGDFESRGRSTAEISGICSGTDLWYRWRNRFGKFVVPGKRNAAFGGWFLGIA